MLSPGRGFQLEDRINMQRAPDRVATFKLLFDGRTGCRTIKLSARMTPNVGKSIAAIMQRSISNDGSPGYDTTVAP